MLFWANSLPVSFLLVLLRLANMKNLRVQTKIKWFLVLFTLYNDELWVEYYCVLQTDLTVETPHCHYSMGHANHMAASTHRLCLLISSRAITLGLPWWLRGKESACQCRRHWFQSLIQEDPKCCRTAKARPVNYGAHVPQILKLKCSRAHAPQQEKPPQWETCAQQLESSPHLPQIEKNLHSNEDPAQPNY